jgi:peptidoglycan/LPS O-acetylase OafA/YrhL
VVRGRPLHSIATTPASFPAPDHAWQAAPPWLERGRIPCLDGLRALSIALVFIEHGTIASHHTHGFMGQVASHIGSLGVDVFFAISGFLITLLLLREVRRNQTISLHAFYTRRFLRLMPAAGAYLLFVLFMQVAGHIHLDPRNWLHVLTYTVNFDPNPVWETGHLWSLSIEEHFYLLWPIVLLLLGPRRSGILAAVWLIAAPVARYVVFTLHPHDEGRFELWTPIRIDCIAAGCLLALLACDSRFRRLTFMSGRAAGLVGALLAVALALSFAAGLWVAHFMPLEGTTRAVCVAAILWLTVVHSQSPWGRLLETKPLVVVGLLSYSLYLWQEPFFDPRLDRWWTRFPVDVVLAVMAAVLSYKLVEQPCLRLKERWGARPPIAGGQLAN